MKKAIMVRMVLVLGIMVIGCISTYYHAQDVKNETGQTITEIKIRDTGSNNWGDVKWDRTNNTEISVLIDSGSSETPKARKNQDILVKDSNGLYYMKRNVRFTYTTYQHSVTPLLVNAETGQPLGKTSTLTTSTPIIFTDQDRLPMLFVVNQTGHPVVVTAPVSSNINKEARTQFQPTETNRSIDVIYRIGQVQFTEQVTMNNADATVTLTKRPPTITVVNQTGRPVNLTAPVSENIASGSQIHFLAPALNQVIPITYRIGQMQLTEQADMRNADVTVTLTRAPPTLTIANNTGVGNNINIIQFRTPGSVAWIGGNIIIRDNQLHLADGTAQTGVTTQVLTNGERLSLWLGNFTLSGNAFDIRLQTPSGIIFQRDNVRITSDMTLTFTQSDKR